MQSQGNFADGPIWKQTSKWLHPAQIVEGIKSILSAQLLYY